MVFVEEKEILKFPSCFQFGFRMDSVEDVKSVYEAMKSDAIEFAEGDSADGETTWLRTRDPDG